MTGRFFFNGWKNNGLIYKSPIHRRVESSGIHPQQIFPRRINTRRLGFTWYSNIRHQRLLRTKMKYLTASYRHGTHRAIRMLTLHELAQLGIRCYTGDQATGQATYFSRRRCWISSTSSGRDAPSQGMAGKEKMTAAVCGSRLKRNSWMGSSTAFSLNLQIDYSDHGRLERSWATLAGGSCKWHLQGKDAHDHHNRNPKYQKVHIKMSQQELHEHIEQSYLVKYKHKAWNKTIWSKPPLSPYLACCWMQQPAENI